MKNNNTKKLAACAVMVALGAVLSMIKVLQMPFGGSITLLSMLLVSAGTFLLCILEPEYRFIQLLFEEVSAFGTVGLSTGITPDLNASSKMVLIVTMFAGRVGAFTLLSMWIDRPAPTAYYTEEAITIG